MTPEILLKNLLEISVSLQEIALEWNQSVDSFPSEPLNFLDINNLKEWRIFCSLPDDVDKSLEEVAKIIINSTELSMLTWHAFRRMYLIPSDNSNFKDWPELRNKLYDKSGAFFLIIALAMVPFVKKKHEEMSIPLEITKDTCRQIFHFSENYRRDFPGEWGIFRRQLYWLRNYSRGQIFRLGRFEYRLDTKYISICIFRHRLNGQVLALAQDSLGFDSEGFLKVEDKNGDFTSTLKEDDNKVSGNIISLKNGFATSETILLSFSEWEKVHCIGDWVLDLHIPSGGGMTMDLCAASFKQAFEFFDHYFPMKKAKAIICHSWMFNPALKQILPPTSNLVQLLNEVNLYPSSKNRRDGFFFLFGQNGDTAELTTLSKETSLQRAIMDYISKGNSWRGGGMFLLREDVSRIANKYLIL